MRRHALEYSHTERRSLFFLMLALLLLATAAAAAGVGAADELAESCVGAQAQAPPLHRLSRDYGFCDTAVWIAVNGLDGRTLEDAGFWSAYASDRAARFTEGGGFHRHHIDMETLEIVPSVSDPAAAFPPDINVTVRFEHGWPADAAGPCPERVWPASCDGGGRFEQTYTMNSDYGFNFWKQSYVVDGRPAHGSTVSCIEGFYLDIDADVCRPWPRCPPATALYNGVCITWKACEGPRDAYVIDGERWECPPNNIRYQLIAGSMPPSHRPPTILGQTPAEWVASCAGAAGPPPGAGRAYDPSYAFCGAVAALGIAPSDAHRIAGEIEWDAYAEQAALHFVDGWGFYQHVGDKDTLEIAPVVDRGGAEGAVPEMSATVRFDYRNHVNSPHIGRGLEAGTFERTLGVSMPPGDHAMPPMIDGAEAPGADIGCPDGYFVNLDPDGCWYSSPCPDDTPVHDGLCAVVHYCDYLYAGEWAFCPETAEEQDELARRYTGEWDPILLPALAALAVLAAIVSLPVLLWLRWRKRRRQRARREGTSGERQSGVAGTPA